MNGGEEAGTQIVIEVFIGGHLVDTFPFRIGQLFLPRLRTILIGILRFANLEQKNAAIF